MQTQLELDTAQLNIDPAIGCMQEKLKNILLVVDKVCKEHNLRYYLIAGTMLGAVRHQGFIPWDDDADIAMPRKDYETFLANAHKWLPAQYELVSKDTNARYPYPFARVQDKETTYIMRRQFPFLGGIPIDVFPLDGMTSNPFKRKIHYFKYHALSKMLYYTMINPHKHGKGIHYAFIKLCRALLPSPQKIHRSLNNTQKEYNYDQSRFIADHDIRPSRGILPKEVYGNPTPLVFEGKELMGVAQPDAYLKHIYGNYMQMPSFSQLPKPNFRYMDTQKPYREYNGAV